jgi:hypothetical protein
MSRKRSIPGVDAESLAALAQQFPSGAARPSETRPEAGNEVLPFKPATATAAGRPARIKVPGRGLAICALLLAIVAVFVAAAAIVPAETRASLAKTVGLRGMDALATGNGGTADPRLAAATQSIGALEGKTAEVTARLEALEAVAGSGAALQRIAAIEASLRTASDRLAAERETDRTAVARTETLEALFAAFDGDLKRIQDSLAVTELNVNDMLAARLGVIEADIGVLQNTDRRPEKLFLTALQLRDVTRNSGPFIREVAAARSLAGGNADLLAAIEVLSANAQDGVATVAELRDNFTTIVMPRLAAVAAANRQPITERALGWVGSLFTTAPSPTTTGDRNGALIALAERSLEQGQLAAATHQLLLLEDEAALISAEWLKNASTRLAADKAMATIMAQALEQLAAAAP